MPLAPGRVLICIVVFHLPSKDQDDLNRLLFKCHDSRSILYEALYEQFLSNDPVKLTNGQKQLVQEVWLEVRHTIDEVGVESFLNFFSTHPEAIDSFLIFKNSDISDLKTSTKLKEHALKVTSVVDRCVARIDDPKAFEAICRIQGANHAGRYITDQFQRSLRDKYIEAIRTRSSVVWNEEYQDAWEAFFNLIQYYMTSSMQEEKAKREQKD